MALGGFVKRLEDIIGRLSSSRQPGGSAQTQSLGFKFPSTLNQNQYSLMVTAIEEEMNNSKRLNQLSNRVSQHAGYYQF